MADIYGRLMDGLRMAEAGRQESRRRGLADLMGKAYNAPAEQRGQIIGQMAGIDPDAAFAAQKQFGGMDDDKRAQISRHAQIFDALPDEQKAQAYPQLAAEVRNLTGMPIPDTYDPKYLPAIQRVAQWSGGAAGGMVQSRFVGEDGQIYALMRDGTVSPLGIKADPNTQIMEAAGGIYSINKRNAQALPVQVGAQAPQGGMPVSIDPSLPPQVQAAIRADESQFANAPDGGSVSIGGGQLQAAPPKVSPVQMAQLQLAQQAGARDQQRLQMAQEAARQKAALPGATTGGVNAQKLAQANATKLAQFQTAERAINRLEQAANSIAGNSFFDGGPMDKFVLGKLPQGQELEQAGASLLPVLTALTRVPGVGAQSDLESRLAALQMPSAEFPPEVNKRAVKALREYMRDLKSALQGQSQAAPSGGSDIDALLDKYK